MKNELIFACRARRSDRFSDFPSDISNSHYPIKFFSLHCYVKILRQYLVPVLNQLKDASGGFRISSYSYLGNSQYFSNNLSLLVEGALTGC